MCWRDSLDKDIRLMRCSVASRQTVAPNIQFLTTAIIKICKFTVFSSASFCMIYRVTNEALIAETMVWPNFFLMNVFFAPKGSKHFIIISYHCSWMLCRVAAVKSLPNSSIVQIIFYFWSFEIMEYILRTRK